MLRLLTLASLGRALLVAPEHTEMPQGIPISFSPSGPSSPPTPPTTSASRGYAQPTPKSAPSAPTATSASRGYAQPTPKTAPSAPTAASASRATASPTYPTAPTAAPTAPGFVPTASAQAFQGLAEDLPRAPPSLTPSWGDFFRDSFVGGIGQLVTLPFAIGETIQNLGSSQGDDDDIADAVQKLHESQENAEESLRAIEKLQKSLNAFKEGAPRQNAVRKALKLALENGLLFTHGSTQGSGFKSSLLMVLKDLYGASVTKFNAEVLRDAVASESREWSWYAGEQNSRKYFEIKDESALEQQWRAQKESLRESWKHPGNIISQDDMDFLFEQSSLDAKGKIEILKKLMAGRVRNQTLNEDLEEINSSLRKLPGTEIDASKLEEIQKRLSNAFAKIGVSENDTLSAFSKSGSMSLFQLALRSCESKTECRAVQQEDVDPLIKDLQRFINITNWWHNLHITDRQAQNTLMNEYHRLYADFTDRWGRKAWQDLKTKLLLTGLAQQNERDATIAEWEKDWNKLETSKRNLKWGKRIVAGAVGIAAGGAAAFGLKNLFTAPKKQFLAPMPAQVEQKTWWQKMMKW